VILDYNTVAAADKFGNVFVLRLPEDANDDAEVSSGVRALWDQGVLSGASIKLEMLCHYYLGEVVTALCKCVLTPGAPELLLASTISGGIFSFFPFSSKDDVAFFKHLEMCMRQDTSNICQRDHLSYRSYYMPVKEVIDGDLCERFNSGAMSYAKQKECASDIDRTPAEIVKKIEDVRSSIM
jgi:splicing factor 3B subunit 3